METPIHKIIRSEIDLQRFVNWLPDLQPHERYFLCLQARKKYLSTLKSSDKTQLKRFVSSKQDLISKIKQLECPVGCYRTREGEPIPDEAMALYITLNPRNMRDATFASIKALVSTLENEQTDQDFNPHNEALSCIHKCKSRSVFVHFDVDRPDETGTTAKSSLSTEDIWNHAASVVGIDAISLIETRGGCHLMIEVSKVNSEIKNWYTEITSRIECDQKGDLMVPVVGCNQGGYVPNFYVR